MSIQREGGAVAVTIPQPRQNQTVLWVIAVLLAIIATALVLRPELPFGARPAFGDTPMMGAGGIYAFTGQIDRNSYGLFMMDVENRTVWCYQYVPNLNEFRLVAARSYAYDRYLENYNGGKVTPDQIRQLLEDERQQKARISRGGIGPEKPLEPSDLTTDMASQKPDEAAAEPAPVSEQPTSMSDE
ncbi:MAG TPA: hypothetical protein VNT79_01815 [Phycisphaerae bacterium]|nr:hypothetical protein [Phycisphaerae bacterium]